MDTIKPQHLLDEAKAIVDKLKQSTKLLKAENIHALDSVNPMVFFMNKINLLKDVHPSDDIRAACTQAHLTVDSYVSRASYDVSEYEAYKRLFANIDLSSDISTKADQKLLEDIIDDYERNGIAHKHKDKLKKILNKITKLCLEYEENITNNNSVLKFSQEELEGVPSYFLDGLDKENGGVVVPLQSSLVDIILKTCEVAKTRNIVDTENKRRCVSNNTILFQISQLRRKLATMLGWKSYADFVLSTRMAGNQQRVLNFLQDITNKTRSYRNKQLEVLRSVGFTNQACDRLFYIEKVKRQFYKIDTDEITQYFPLEHVLKEIFKLLSKLFGIAFKETSEVGWHSDVRMFSILSSTTKEGTIIGKFYVDFYSRNNKFEGFACYPLVNKILSSDGETNIPICALVCNFIPPTETTPCLLPHFHVEILLHELGHVIHHTFGAAKYATFSGTNTEHDFVEMPSQMLEHLVWDSKIIKEISQHWKTKAQLPDTTITMLLSSSLSGLDYSHQLVYSIFDQELHGIGFESCDEMVARFKALRKEIEGIEASDATELTIFGHLVGDYGGAYYTYLWSKVFADDIYNTLEKNPSKWKDYIDKILRPGGTIHAHDMMVNFFGREPSDEAFLTLL